MIDVVPVVGQAAGLTASENLFFRRLSPLSSMR